MIFQHTLDVECLQTDHLVLAYKFGRHFVLKIAARIGYPGVQFGDLVTGLLPVLTALFLLRKLALGFGYLLLIPGVVFRVC